MLQVLAHQLGCWPLLLDLANARLLEEQKARRGTVAESIARVSRIFERRGVVGFDRRDSQARNAAVERSIDVGLDFAEKGFPGIAKKAAEIAVFPEDVSIPVSVLADLWHMDETDVEEEVVRPLDNVSLLRWTRHTNDVLVHDMIRRALAMKLLEPVAVHRKLLESWGDPCRLPHAYAWRWFGWHCVGANEKDRLLNVLLDYAWLSAKLAATEINALVDEFDYLRGDPQVELLQTACRRSASVLARDKAQLAGSSWRGFRTPRISYETALSVEPQDAANVVAPIDCLARGGTLNSVAKTHKTRDFVTRGLFVQWPLGRPC